MATKVKRVAKSMSVPVFFHPEAEDRPRIEAAIDDVNRLQSYFRLSREPVTWLPNGNQHVSSARLERTIRARSRGRPALAVINNPFDDNWFSHGDRDFLVASVWDWEALYAPPSLRTYLVYEFAGGLLDFAGDLSSEFTDKLQHRESIGCLYDFCAKKPSITMGMVAANLCARCESWLLGMEMPRDAIAAVEILLAHVRAASIRRAREIPDRVFIGHGRDETWRELEALLRGWDLDVVEFNREPTPGISTSDRLEHMLEESRFAFLVMTPEDGDPGAMRARPNVIHEAGLFQGRLGFRRAILVRHQNCATFSNLAGMTEIAFAQGKLREKKTEIRRTLVREGLL